MKPSPWLFLLLAPLGGCLAVTPTADLAHGADPSPVRDSQTVSAGLLNVAIRWPKRTAQAIPLSTETLRLQVLKDGVVRASVLMNRPGTDTLPLTSVASVRLAAESDLMVEAEALPLGGGTPLASGSVEGVAIVANQRTNVQLVLNATFVPMLTDFTPKNGGPGVLVTLSGDFGHSGYYGLSLSGLPSDGTMSGGHLIAPVPNGATTSPLIALADGVSSAPGEEFVTLSGVTLSPQSGTLPVGGTQPFTTLGVDTASQTVANPTITRWAVIQPTGNLFAKPSPSNVGTITPEGVFTAQAPGSAWVAAYSGLVVATASVTVN